MYIKFNIRRIQVSRLDGLIGRVTSKDRRSSFMYEMIAIAGTQIGIQILLHGGTTAVFVGKLDYLPVLPPDPIKT